MPVIIKGKLIDPQSPKVCVSITSDNAAGILENARILAESDIEVVEWRADYFQGVNDEGQLFTILNALKNILSEKIFIFTLRSHTQGGVSNLEDAAAKSLLRSVAAKRCADVVDVEYFMLEEADSLIREIQNTGTIVIASHHRMEDTLSEEEMKRLLTEMEEADPDIIKLAQYPKSAADLARIMKVTATMAKASGIPYITIAMGERGLVSRVMPESFGSCISFASMDASPKYGQLPFERLLKIRELING